MHRLLDWIAAAAKILAGTLANGSASLAVSATEALATNFSSASGKCILATPTDGMNTNETSGIWFLEAVSGSPVSYCRRYPSGGAPRAGP